MELKEVLNCVTIAMELKEVLNCVTIAMELKEVLSKTLLKKDIIFLVFFFHWNFNKRFCTTLWLGIHFYVIQRNLYLIFGC